MNNEPNKDPLEEAALDQLAGGTDTPAEEWEYHPSTWEYHPITYKASCGRCGVLVSGVSLDEANRARDEHEKKYGLSHICLAGPD